MDEVEEKEQLRLVFRNLGADDVQASMMADQTIKRATQLCEQRGIDRVSAMKYLLDLVSKGRAGEVPESLSEPPSSPGRKGDKSHNS